MFDGEGDENNEKGVKIDIGIEGKRQQPYKNRIWGECFYERKKYQQDTF